MTAPIWVDLALVTAIQSEQLAVFGGASGIRDATLLQSALDRPRNKWAYGEQDLIVLAAALCFGLAKNHGYVDGNKRTAFLSSIVFLGLSGINFSAAEPDAVVMMEALAAGALTEDELTAWIRTSIAP
ncbi:MAG: type II toxin-antitoxin system death-on-curing family toxin [Hyphomicrobiaceae bacterium]